MSSSDPIGRDVSNRHNKRRLRRCKHSGRNKCDNCPEPNVTNENCDVFGRVRQLSAKSEQEPSGSDFEDENE